MISGCRNSGEIIDSTFTNSRSSITTSSILADTSSVSVSGKTVAAGSQISASLELGNVEGTAGDHFVVFGTRGGSSTGQFSSSSYDGNGIYSATFTGQRAGTPTEVVAFLDGSIVDNANNPPRVQVTVGPISLSESKAEINSSDVQTLLSGSSATLRITLRDYGRNIIPDASLASNISLTVLNYGTSTATLGTLTPVPGSEGIYETTITGITAGSQTEIQTEISGKGKLSSQPRLRVQPGPPASMTAVSGTGQSGTVGLTVNAFGVRVQDSNSNLIPNQNVNWAINSGGGSLSATSSVTNGSGVASTILTLGPLAGNNLVTATIPGTAIATQINATAVYETTGVSSDVNDAFSFVGVNNWTGSVQDYTVPTGVDSLTIIAWGAGGGGANSSDYAGGAGGYAQGIFNVTPGETLSVYVAGGGEASRGSRRAAGGGGASAVLRASTPLLVAAGGGGAGSCGYVDRVPGGAGGGMLGQSGAYTVAGSRCDGPGFGGNQSTAGARGVGSRRAGYDGSGRNGGHGSGSISSYGGWGYGIGGGGGYVSNDAGGGGGGGGYYGGGGGGGAAGGAGGGGGSSYVAAGSNNFVTAGNDSTPPHTDSDHYADGIAVGSLPSHGGNGRVVFVRKGSIIAWNPAPAQSGLIRGNVMPTFKVQIMEPNGSIRTSDSSTTVTLSLTSGGGNLGGTLVRTLDQGVATFDDITYDQAEIISIRATSSSGTYVSRSDMVVLE